MVALVPCVPDEPATAARVAEEPDVSYGDGEVCPECQWSALTVESRHFHDDHCQGYAHATSPEPVDEPST